MGKSFTDEREERSYDHNRCVACGSDFSGDDGKGVGFVTDDLGRRWNASCATRVLSRFLRHDEDRSSMRQKIGKSFSYRL